MDNKIVRMVCPNLRCRTVLSVPATARGKSVRCRQCGFRIKIPMTKAKTTKPQPENNNDTDAA